MAILGLQGIPRRRGHHVDYRPRSHGRYNSSGKRFWWWTPARINAALFSTSIPPPSRRLGAFVNDGTTGETPASVIPRILIFCLLAS